MDGTERWRDNVFVERLGRGLKHEEGYLHAYETVGAAREGVARSMTFYNQIRPHRALACTGRTDLNGPLLRRRHARHHL